MPVQYRSQCAHCTHSFIPGQFSIATIAFAMLLGTHAGIRIRYTKTLQGKSLFYSCNLWHLTNVLNGHTQLIVQNMCHMLQRLFSFSGKCCCDSFSLCISNCVLPEGVLAGV